MQINKGFTLVELIGVIVIIGVLALIAVPVYNAIQKNVLERQYKSVVHLIEAKAINYVEDNKVLIVDIDTLVKDGYLDSDDDKYIYDPRDRSIMNCYAIDVKIENNTYVANLNLKKNYIQKDNTCNTEAFLAENSNLTIYSKINGIEEKITEDKWFNNNKISLIAKLNGKEINSGSFLWTSTNGERSTNSSVDINVSKILKTKYTLRYETEEGFIYEQKADINIDTEKPIIYEDEIVISNRDIWTYDKTIKINATDQNGSGIIGYYVGILECNDPNAIYEKSNSQNYESIRLRVNNRNYNICVKDKAGNIKEISKKIFIDKIDDVKPTCEFYGENTRWTNRSVTITIGCKDNESGCDINRSNYPISFSSTTEKSTVSKRIYDNVGNYSDCSKYASVYVDTTSPTCSYNGGNTSWTKNDVNVYIGCSDSDSGCASGYSGSPHTFKSSAKTDTYSYTIKDEAGNSTYCSKSFNVYIDKIAPSCTTDKTNINSPDGVTVSISCSDSLSGVPNCPAQEVGIKKSKSYTVKDELGNTNTCNVIVSSEKKWRKKQCDNCDSCYGDWSGYGSTGCYRNKPRNTETTQYSCTTPDDNNCGWGVGEGKMCKKRTRTYYSNNCRRCGCTKWGSWSKYIYNKCNDDADTNCQSQIQYF